jgi:hypothetical protein
MSQAEAAEMSRELALESANELNRANGWNSVSLTTYKVAGDPFWKAVRPDGDPDYAQLKPDIVTPAFTPPALQVWWCRMSARRARVSAGCSIRQSLNGRNR